MKYFVVYNKFSGLVYSQSSEEDVKAALRDARIDFEFAVTSEPGEAAEAARDACKKVDGPVVACGGDGTVNEVLNGIMGTEKPLGIIPNGTSNLLAEELGIPRGLKEACSILANRKFKRIDVGQANKRYFLMMSGVGFDALSIKDIKPEQKRFLGWWAYLYSGIFNLFRHKRFKVKVDSKDMKKRKKLKARLIVVSNIKSYGTKDIQMAPYARFDDGLLDICIFRSQKVWDLLVHAFKIIFRLHHLEDRQITYFQTDNLKLYSRKKVPVHVDCEIIGNLPVEFSVLPQALSVIVP